MLHAKLQQQQQVIHEEEDKTTSTSLVDLQQLSTDHTASSMPNSSTTSLISLVQSIMAEPVKPMIMTPVRQVVELDEDDVKPIINVNPTVSDANDVSSTHTAPEEIMDDKEDQLHSIEQAEIVAPCTSPPNTEEEEEASTQLPLDSFVFPAVKEEHQDEFNLFASPQQPPEVKSTARNNSDPLSSPSTSSSTHSNADYKSVLQVQQEALGSSSFSQLLPQDQHIANANFEASTLASLLSTAAAADMCSGLNLNSMGTEAKPATTAGKKRSHASSSCSASSTIMASPPNATSASMVPASNAVNNAAPVVKKPSSKRKSYPCRYGCNIIFRSKEEYWMHNRMHINPEKALQCPECSFLTEYKHHLEYHVRNHRGAKPFKCPDCDYSCVNKSMLKSHLKSHSDNFIYNCAECSYATKYCHSLKLHLSKYGHKAVPRPPRKSQAARRRSSSTSQQRNNNVGLVGAGGTAADPDEFDENDDDDEDEEEMLIGAVEDGGDEIDEKIITLPQIGSFVSLPPQQLLLSQFNGPMQQQQQFGTPIMQQNGLSSNNMMPTIQQQIDAAELIRRSRIINMGENAAQPTSLLQRTPPSIMTTASARNGNTSLAGLLGAVNISPNNNNNNNNVVLNGMQQFQPMLVGSSSSHAGLVTNRVSFTGGTQILPNQQNFGSLAMSQVGGPYSSPTPNQQQQLTNALANLSALNNSVGQQQHQRNNMLCINGGGISGGELNNFGGGQQIHDMSGGGGGTSAIMQLNNPILANALQNVSHKLQLQSSPAQQQQQQQQTKIFAKSSPPNSSVTQLYNNLLINGGSHNSNGKMFTLQQIQRDMTPTEHLQQQQQPSSSNIFLPFSSNSTNNNNSGQQQHQQQTDFFSHSKNLLSQPQQLPLGLLLNGIPSNNMDGSNNNIGAFQNELNNSTTISSLADLSSLLNNALVGRLSAALTQQATAITTSTATSNGKLLSFLPSSSAQLRNGDISEHANDSNILNSNNSGGAPLSLLATLSQLLNNNKQQPQQQLLDVATSLVNQQQQQPIQSPKPNGNLVVSNLSQGFDLTQALNVLAMQQRQQQQQQQQQHDLQNNISNLVADSSLLIPPPAATLTAQLAVTAAASAATTTTKEQPSSSSSSTCSGSTTTRLRKRKGQAFKLDSVLRKRLLLEVSEEDDENHHHNQQQQTFTGGNTAASTVGSTSGQQRQNSGAATSSTSATDGGDSGRAAILLDTHSDALSISGEYGGNERRAAGDSSKHSTSDAGEEASKTTNKKSALLAQLRVNSVQSPQQAADKRLSAAEESSSSMQPLPVVSERSVVNNNTNSTTARATSDSSSSSSGEGSASVWADSFICTHCGIAFLDCTMYTLHMGVHGLNNPFTCNSCGKSTKDKIEFYLHLIREPHHRQQQ